MVEKNLFYCANYVFGFLTKERRGGGFTALPSRMLHRRVNSDSAVSGNIRLRAEKLIGMPHSILHAFNTFQFNAGQMCVTSKHPHHFLHETKT